MQTHLAPLTGELSAKLTEGFAPLSKRRKKLHPDGWSFLIFGIDRSALAELRRTTGGLETVLHETEARFCLILRGFSSFLLFVHQFLNPRFCRLLSDFNPNLFLMCRLLC